MEKSPTRTRFAGLLLKESLKDESVLGLVQVTKQEIWSPITNAADYQPTAWTAISFERSGSEYEVNTLAGALSSALKAKWYLNMSSVDTVYVVFPDHRIFKYAKGDRQRRAEAVDYGRSIGIPDSQLDWAE